MRRDADAAPLVLLVLYCETPCKVDWLISILAKHAMPFMHYNASSHANQYRAWL